MGSDVRSEINTLPVSRAHRDSGELTSLTLHRVMREVKKRVREKKTIQENIPGGSSGIFHNELLQIVTMQVAMELRKAAGGEFLNFCLS